VAISCASVRSASPPSRTGFRIVREGAAVEASATASACHRRPRRSGRRDGCVPAFTRSDHASSNTGRRVRAGPGSELRGGHRPRLRRLQRPRNTESARAPTFVERPVRRQGQRMGWNHLASEQVKVRVPHALEVVAFPSTVPASHPFGDPREQRPSTPSAAKVTVPATYHSTRRSLLDSTTCGARSRSASPVPRGSKHSGP
jgi:hypothetical protein